MILKHVLPGKNRIGNNNKTYKNNNLLKIDENT